MGWHQYVPLVPLHSAWLRTGEINLPYAWQPAVVEISVLRAGQLIILAVPGEFTTMAGRRLRAAVYDMVCLPADGVQAVSKSWGHFPYRAVGFGSGVRQRQGFGVGFRAWPSQHSP